MIARPSGRAVEGNMRHRCPARGDHSERRRMMAEALKQGRTAMPYQMCPSGRVKSAM
nr:MAG TPA: hypothetical protein [Caudoviricetes sp.]